MVQPIDARSGEFHRAGRTVAGGGGGQYRVTTQAVTTFSGNLSRRLWSMGAATVAAVFIAGFAAGTRSGHHPTTSGSAIASPCAGFRLSMTVRRGDSLWSLAKRYGDPNAYILDRVDEIARANGIASTAHLFPGQRVIVPVTNPLELTRLQRTLALK